MSSVMIHPADYENVRPAVDLAFELFPLDIQGRSVLIKPNVLRGSAPEEGIVTHPAVLRAVVDKVESLQPASIVVGDNPGLFNYGDNERCFEQTGLMEAAKGYYRNIGTSSVQLAFDPEFMPHVGLSSAVCDADVVISLPKFKTHGLTVITGAVKNSYGFLPGAQKAHLHKAAGSPERFHRVIAEVFRLRVPDLVIMDAVVGMEGNGPASPDLREIGCLLASSDALALDAVMAHMMGLDPQRLPHLTLAAEYGLGSLDLEGISIHGEPKQLADFKLPPLSGQALLDNAAIQDLIHSKTQLVPQADPELCTACGSCIEQCPVSALAMDGDVPLVDADTCITCFCCQEICPEKAITLR
jgi:uncharacterized protein (DUF362 family)/NAD-dependent dihydropyrimidine dehydrogenase PreA subunit